MTRDIAGCFRFLTGGKERQRRRFQSAAELSAIRSCVMGLDANIHPQTFRCKSLDLI
jgi:hypothetical protein